MRKAIKEGRFSGLAGLVIGRPKQRAIKCKDHGWLGPVSDLLETCLDWMLTGPYFWICPFLFQAWIRALLVWLDCCDSSFRFRRLYTVWLPNWFDSKFFNMLFLHGFRLTVAAVHDWTADLMIPLLPFFPLGLSFAYNPPWQITWTVFSSSNLKQLRFLIYFLRQLNPPHDCLDSNFLLLVWLRRCWWVKGPKCNPHKASSQS